MKHNEGKIYELSSGGMPVAGDFLDIKIATKVHSKIARKKKRNLSFDDMAPVNRDMMIVKAERAKCALYDDDTATISINDYGVFGSVRETLGYDWFYEIIDSEVNQAINCLKKVVDESEVGMKNIDRIIMVGGSSNLRPVIEKMYAVFGEKLYFPEETMWNVGVGTAMLSITPGKYYSNQKIGIRLSDNSLFTLLNKNELVNNWNSRHHFGIIDSNKEARFIFSGSKDIDDDDSRFYTLEIPAYRFLQEQIIVESWIDENLIFNVEVSSSMRTKLYNRIWTYDRLKCFYKLPKEGGLLD